MRKFLWFLAVFPFSLLFAPLLAVSRTEAVFPPVPSPSPVLAPGAEISQGNRLVASILTTADRLSAEYDSRPPYGGPIFAPGEALTPDQAIQALPYVISCESEDKSVKIVDSNGFYSYGILQIQSSTWAGFMRQSGMTGNPMVKDDAVMMALWAFEHGYADLWTCAGIEHVIHIALFRGPATLKM